MISILVVSYNTHEMTLECIRSVFEQTRLTPFELVVIDNASTDGSADALEEEFGARLRLIRSGENLGFAGANNAAASVARGDFLLMLNPDTVVLDGAIDRLVAFARERPEAKIWGGRTLFADGTLNPGSCWRRQTLWSLISQVSGLSAVFRDSAFFNPESYGGWSRGAVREVDIVSGCFFLIERATWDRLGGFHPDFFMYGEEADLCLRARRLGARPTVTPDATIVHHGGASERVRTDKMSRLLRAKMLLLRRHLPAWQQTLACPMLAMWPLSRAAAWRVVALLRRRASDRESAATWEAVWTQRGTWWGAGRTDANITGLKGGGA